MTPRSAGADEAKALLTLLLSAREEIGLSDRFIDSEEYVNWMAKACADQRVHVLGPVGDVIGLVMTDDETVLKTAYRNIDYVVLAVGHRGAGLGKSLVRYCQAAGLDMMAEPRNADAVKMLQRCRFRENRRLTEARSQPLIPLRYPIMVWKPNYGTGS
jgi:ribosomal protein S18 acetylase RimI-like enzyme